MDVTVFHFLKRVNLKSTGENNLGAGKKSANVQPALPATNQHEIQTIPNSYQQNQKELNCN